MFKLKSSKMNKIAVCLYGQYRTGDYVLPFIAKQFEHENVDVDFFCSFKDFNTYERNKTYQENTSSANEKEFIDVEATSEYIKKILKPTIIRPMNPPRRDKQRYKVSNMLSGIVESLSLKQRHELKTNTQYDFVFLLRYDVLFNDGAVKQMLDKLRGLNSEELFSLTRTNNECLYTTYISYPQPHSELNLYTPIQDLFFAGSSLAFDLMVTAYENMLVMNNQEHAILDYYTDGHVIHNIACNECGVVPMDINTVLGINVHWACVRSDFDLSLDVHLESTLSAANDHWRKSSVHVREIRYD